MSTPFYDLASLVVVPSGYKASKVYAQKPLTTDGQLTFSRASTATRVNASGLIETVASNVPRLDYLNSTCPKLQLEPQRTNSLELSENLGAYPLFNMTAATSSVTSPDGGTNAWRLTSTAAFGVLYSSRTVTGVQTLSVFCKYVSAANMRVGFTDTSDYETIFNVQTGTIVSSTAGITGKIEAYPNGWYRCSVTRTIAGASANMYFGATASGGVYDFFGAQLEAGAYSTSYLKTTGAAVTRLADACSKTGISSLIGQTEGTGYVEFDFNGKYSASGVIALHLAGNAGKNIYFGVGTNNEFFYEVQDTSYVVSITGFFTTQGTKKVAFAYKENDFVLYINGVQIGTDTSGTVPALSEVYLGALKANSNYNLSSTISQALVFKTRLTNAQLAELTTL